MGANTHIEWCDHTFNPWEGCTMVSPGCANCYAEARNARFGGGTAPNWGKGAPRRRTSASNWAQPVKWNKEAEAGNGPEVVIGNPSIGIEVVTRRPRVFCASLADWLDDEVPLGWLQDLLRLIHDTPHLDWLLLTKRPENAVRTLWDSQEDFRSASEIMHDEESDYSHEMADWLWDWLNNGAAPANVWIGTTVEDQTRADERIPALLRIPARVRFLSCEPLLGPVDLGLMGTVSKDICPNYTLVYQHIHWVIAGGESGPKARPMHPDWARSLRNQCQAAGVPFLFKQWGEWLPDNQRDFTVELGKHEFAVLNPDGTRLNHRCAFTPPTAALLRMGKKASGRLLDGVEHNGYPTA